MRKLQRQLLNGDVHRGRNTLQTKEFDLYDHTNHSARINYFLIKSSYIHQEEIDVPINEDGEFYWANKIVPMINKKYCEIRANINSGIKLEYFGKFSYLNLLRWYFLMKQ